MKKTLLILAAGIGSRYGGVKQLEKFGKNGETIIHYSIYDALKYGFNKIVFIIRKELETDFNTLIISQIKNLNIEIKIVYQDMPSNISRTKPLGSTHAVLSAKNVINEIFLMINADDFYNEISFKLASKEIDRINKSDDKKENSLIAYKLKNTMSKHGSVSRGVCFYKEENNKKILTDIQEHKKVYFENEEIKSEYDNQILSFKNEIVSMNMFILQANIFSLLEEKFNIFLDELNDDNILNTEAYISSDLAYFLKKGLIKFNIIDSPALWFGVTYKEDKNVVIKSINKLIENKIYPETLFK